MVLVMAMHVLCVERARAGMGMPGKSTSRGCCLRYGLKCRPLFNPRLPASSWESSFCSTALPECPMNTGLAPWRRPADINPAQHRYRPATLLPSRNGHISIR